MLKNGLPGQTTPRHLLLVPLSLRNKRLEHCCVHTDAQMSRQRRRVDTDGGKDAETES